MSEGKWPIASLGDLASSDSDAVSIGPFGSSMKSDVYVEDGVPVVRGMNLDGLPGFKGEFVYVADNTADRLSRSLVSPGDLVFPHRGAIGSVGIAGDEPPGRWLLSTSMMKFRPDRTRLDPYYAFHFFRSAAGRHELLKNASQVGTPGIGQPLASLRSCKIPLPPIHEQRAIARVLSALDDKIHHNRRTAQAMDNWMHAVFQAWFVDFQPIKAKAVGAAGFPSVPQHVFDSLPASFTDSAIGPIPLGWGVGTLGHVAQERRESVQPEDVPTGTPYIGLEHIPRRRIALTDWGDTSTVSSNKRRVSAGQIMFGKLRPYFHKVCVAPTEAICSTDIVVINPTERLWNGFVISLVSSDKFVDYASAVSTGTKMPRTGWRDMARYDMALPPVGLVGEFAKIVDPILGTITSNALESRELASMRDYLLPRLLSGAVRVLIGDEWVEGLM